MALPYGTISLSQVNVELNKPSSQQISLNDSEVRALANVSSSAANQDGSGPSSTISMSSLWGKSNVTYMVASGGTQIDSGSTRYHVFSSSGTFTVTTAAPNTPAINYLVVAGGGGTYVPSPGYSNPGGGGGGGLKNSSVSITSPGSYTITVGGGGGPSGQATGSSIGTLVTTTRGGNAHAYPTSTFGPGGSGGGGSYFNSYNPPSFPESKWRGDGTSGEGSPGGYFFAFPAPWAPGNIPVVRAGGGGGSAYAPGYPGIQPYPYQPRIANSRNGKSVYLGVSSPTLGPGIPSPTRSAWLSAVSNSPSLKFAGGGGGSSTCPPNTPLPVGTSVSNAGVYGGGGNGNRTAPGLPTVARSGSNGLANTGGGAGGGTSGTGFSGGSGIVIIWYQYK